MSRTKQLVVLGLLTITAFFETHAASVYSFAAVDAPFATSTSIKPATYLNGINDLGQVVGYYQEGNPLDGLGGPSGITYQGFVRNTNGDIAKITAPHSLYGNIATGINTSGAISGYLTEMRYALRR